MHFSDTIDEFLEKNEKPEFLTFYKLNQRVIDNMDKMKAVYSVTRNFQ